MVKADDILRKQADRLNLLLGMKEGAYLDKADLKRIIDTPFGDEIEIKGKKVRVGANVKGQATLVLGKV